jgi:peptidoglycan/xylan/chitin deacetylase (PgdA/CDA1 family)
MKRALAAAAAVAWFGPGLAPHVPMVADALGIRRWLRRSDGVILTFDDGPHPEGTPAVLDALGDAPALFFLVGEQVDLYPELAAEVAARGHEVAVHGYRHRNQMLMTPGALRDDMTRAGEAIGEATGSAPRIYRPPYGIFTPAGLKLARDNGWLPLLWSRWGRDWRANTTPEEIARLATRDLERGDVILLHDADWYSSPGSHRRTAAALPQILGEARRRGLYPTGSASAAGALTHST